MSDVNRIGMQGVPGGYPPRESKVNREVDAASKPITDGLTKSTESTEVSARDLANAARPTTPEQTVGRQEIKPELPVRQMPEVTAREPVAPRFDVTMTEDLKFGGVQNAEPLSLQGLTEGGLVTSSREIPEDLVAQPQPSGTFPFTNGLASTMDDVNASRMGRYNY
jgi:hypothetical protein